MKRLMCFVLIFSLLFTITGCWDARDIEDIALSSAMAIDKTPDGKIKVTLQIINPANISPTGGGVGGGGIGQGSKYWNVSGTGNTISQAISKISNSMPKTFYLAQNNIIIIGESLAKSGFGKLLDSTVREPTIRLTNYVLISKGYAYDILAIPPNIEEVLSSEILESITTLAFANTVPSQIKDIAACFIGPSSCFATTKIEGVAKSPQPEQGNQSGKNDPESDKQINLQGLAIVKKGKLIDYLTQNESYGYALIKNKVPRLDITVTYPGIKNSQIGIHIIRAISNTSAEIKDGKLIYNVKVNAEGDITEIACDLNVLNPQNIDKINKAVEKKLSDYIHITFNKAQNLDADFLEFLNIFRKSYPKEYKIYKNRWDELFPTIQLNVKVEYNTRRHGVNSRSIQE